MTKPMPNESTPLYALTETYRAALVELEDLDLPEDAVRDTLEGLRGELEEKALNVAAYFQNLEATAQAVRQAEKHMQERRKRIERRIASMKHYLLENMQACGITRIDSPQFSLVVRRNPGTVVIDREDELPAEFVLVRTERVPDKTSIRARLKAGESVTGAHLEHSSRLEVK